MAFTLGAPAAVVKLVSERVVRISQIANPETPFRLANGATGTIGLAEKTVAGDITLPAGFQPRPYERPDGAIVSLQDSISVKVFDGSNPVATQAPLGIVKSGTTPEDFEISIENSGAAASGQLEIYIEFH